MLCDISAHEIHLDHHQEGSKLVGKIIFDLRRASGWGPRFPRGISGDVLGKKWRHDSVQVFYYDAFIMTHLLWRIYYWIIAYPTKVEEYLAYCNKAIQTNWRNVMWRIFVTHFCDAFLWRIFVPHSLWRIFVTHFVLNNNDTFKSWGAFDRL